MDVFCFELVSIIIIIAIYKNFPWGTDVQLFISSYKSVDLYIYKLSFFFGKIPTYEESSLKKENLRGNLVIIRPLSSCINLHTKV